MSTSIKIWSPDVIARLSDLAAAGLTFSQIAVEFRCSRGTIAGQCHKHNIQAGVARKKAVAELKARASSAEKLVLPPRHYKTDWGSQ